MHSECSTMFGGPSSTASRPNWNCNRAVSFPPSCMAQNAGEWQKETSSNYQSSTQRTGEEFQTRNYLLSVIKRAWKPFSWEGDGDVSGMCLEENLTTSHTWPSIGHQKEKGEEEDPKPPGEELWKGSWRPLSTTGVPFGSYPRTDRSEEPLSLLYMPAGIRAVSK